MKVSIIVPIYNVEEFLEKCIDSIVNQTYKNLEIILINDGSKDNCLKICKKYAKKDKRIIIIDKENGGLSSARNAGLDIATGDYIFCIDSDDYIDLDTIDYLVNLSENGTYDIISCLYEKKNEMGCSLNHKKKKEKIMICDRISGLSNLLYSKNCTNSAWGKLYKRNLFNNIRYPNGKICEDLATTYKLFERADKIIISNLPKYKYLIRSNSIINSSFKDSRLDGLLFAEEICKFIDNKYPSLINAAKNRLFMESIAILYCIPYDEIKYKKTIEKLKNIYKDNRFTVMFDVKANVLSKFYSIIGLSGIKFLKGKK